MLFGPLPALIISIPTISVLLITGHKVLYGFMIIIGAIIVVVNNVFVAIISTYPVHELLIILL